MTPIDSGDVAAGSRRAPVPPALARETGYLLRRVFARATEALATELPADVSTREFGAIRALADRGPRSQRDLGRLLDINRSAMVGLIDTLERRGLVERVRNPADRRAYALRLTPSGCDLLPDLSAAADRAECDLTTTLTPQDRDRAAALLEEIGRAGDPGAEPSPGSAARVVLAVGPAHHHVRGRVTGLLRDLGLTPARYGTLSTLDAAGPTSQRAIADQLGLSGPTVLETIDRLEQDDLVERHRDPRDRRSYALRISDRGQRVLREARAGIESVTAALDDLLGTGPHDELRTLLIRILTT